MKKIVSDCLQNSFNYNKYEEVIIEIQNNPQSLNKNSADNNDSISSQINESKFDDLILISKDTFVKVNNLKNNYSWLIITENWCVDVVHLITVCNKIAVVSEKIELKIAFIEKEAVYIHNTTNEPQIFPTLIILDKNNKMLAQWGPRPKGATDLMKSKTKKSGKIPISAFEEMKMWYLQNKGVSTQFEIMSLMSRLEPNYVESIVK